MSNKRVLRSSACCPKKKVKTDDNMCAICQETMEGDETKEIALECGHTFHAVCIVPSLQQDRRCPVCRHLPKSLRQKAEEERPDVEEDELDDDDEALDEAYDDAMDMPLEICEERLMKRIGLNLMNRILSNFQVPAAQDRRVAAALISEQLHYETDTEE